MQEDLTNESWTEFAAHLGFSDAYIEIMCDGWRDMSNRFHERCMRRMSIDWAARKEGTGSRPRNLKTLLEVFKRFFLHSQDTLFKLSCLEEKLIRGVDLNTAVGLNY